MFAESPSIWVSYMATKKEVKLALMAIDNAFFAYNSEEQVAFEMGGSVREASEALKERIRFVIEALRDECEE